MRKYTKITFPLLLSIFALINYNYNSSTTEAALYEPYNSEWGDFAIGLKTGKRTVLKRVPIQMATFLSDVRNLEIFGDEDAIMGELKMINIIKNSSYAKSMDDLIKHIGRDPPKNPDEELIPEKTSVGWMMDAHKNLPALDYLLQKYPDAKWFLLIDDDTYLFKRNLKNYLKTLNSSENHYIGVPYSFNGCDGVKKGEKSPLFAQGGSGILISNAALKQMAPIIPDCSRKYRDCTAGDIRTALCLRDVGIYLTYNYGFNAFPPSLFNTLSPCFNPLTYHHMLPTHFEDLYSLDVNNVTMNDIFHYYARKNGHLDGMGVIEKDSDRRGSDYKVMFSVTSSKQCFDLCKDEEKCVAFSYSPNACWLKHAIPKKTASSGFSSGAFPEKFHCKENK